MGEIKHMFDTHLNITITPILAKSIIRFVTAYETVDQNAKAFNSPYLGVHKCCFLNTDRDNFFSLFDTDFKYIQKLISPHVSGNKTFNISLTDLQNFIKKIFTVGTKLTTIKGLTNKELKILINDISTVDKNFNVVSDPFNLFITYLLHRTKIAAIPDALKEETMFKTIMLLQYKFFTSLVNYRFKYPANENVARAAFEALNNRFDIKVYGTWKKLMEARGRQFISNEGLHYQTILNYDDDKKILYILSDTQSRIRNQVNTVMDEFMKTKANEDIIGTYSHLGTTNEGQIKMMDGTEGFDLLISSVYNDSLSVPRLLDEQAIRLISGLFSNLSAAKLRSVLISFSEYAVQQAKSGQSKKIITENDRTIFIGTEVLIQNLIQKTYRYCIFSKVNMSRPVEIIKTTKDVYSSSRILDEGIVSVRESVAKLILEIQDSRREATIATLRIAFITYLILISIKYLKS